MRSRSRSSRSRGGGADTRFWGGAAGGAAGCSRSRFFVVFRTRGTSGPFVSPALSIFQPGATTGVGRRPAGSLHASPSPAYVGHALYSYTRGKLGRAYPRLLASVLQAASQTLGCYYF